MSPKGGDRADPRGRSAGQRLFRWRSHTPLAVLAPLLLLTWIEPVPFGGPGRAAGFRGVGIALGALGLAVRALVIGFAPAGTSGRATRAMRADTITTDGAYALVRHPMYLGNALLWLGVSAFAAHPAAPVFVALAFLAIHRPIASAEDRYLATRFGERFETWAARTPQLLPRSLRWRSPRRPFRARAVLARDYHALFAFVAATWAVEAVRSAAITGSWSPSTGSWLHLGLGVVFFSVLHALKSKTTLLEP